MALIVWLDAAALSVAVAAAIGVAHGLGHPVRAQVVMGHVPGGMGRRMHDVGVGLPLVLRQGEL